MARLPAKEKKAFASRLKQIWLQPDRESAIRYANMLIDHYEHRFPEAMKVLKSGLGDSL